MGQNPILLMLSFSSKGTWITWSKYKCRKIILRNQTGLAFCAQQLEMTIYQGHVDTMTEELNHADYKSSPRSVTSHFVCKSLVLNSCRHQIVPSLIGALKGFHCFCWLALMEPLVLQHRQKQCSAMPLSAIHDLVQSRAGSIASHKFVGEARAVPFLFIRMLDTVSALKFCAVKVALNRNLCNFLQQLILCSLMNVTFLSRLICMEYGFYSSSSVKRILALSSDGWWIFKQGSLLSMYIIGCPRVHSSREY